MRPESGRCTGLDFSAVTYVGDGAWDVKAARQLGWNFIGVGAGEAAEQLKRAGAETVIPDFEPTKAFLELLRKLCESLQVGTVRAL